MENKAKHLSKKIRKGDRVLAISGNSKGLSGTVQSRKGDRVVVQGLNLRKKHVKKSQEAPRGRIVDIERAIHISNLRVCVGEDQPVKLKVRHDQGDRKFVYSQGKPEDKLEGDKEVVYRSLKKPK